MASAGSQEPVELRKVVDGRATGAPFLLPINPMGIKDLQEVELRENRAMGSAGLARDFAHTPPSQLSLEFILDGTGVLAESEQDDIPDVVEQVDRIREITQEYDGSIHEPPWVEVVWGGFICRGRTTSMDVEYTVFSPTGKPLRATVKLEIERSLDEEEEQKRKNNSSPDLTHIVIVKAGDTLPLLCQRIYQDTRYYLEVARHNELIDFRNLIPGSELHFPPLR